MANNEAQARFDFACQNYKEVEGILKEMTAQVQSFQADFKFEWAMLQYDLILQAILLSAAIADGKYLAIENSFIKQITDYGDITLAFNKKSRDENLGLPELNWDNLSELIVNGDNEFRAKLVAAFSAIAMEYSNTLIGFFAPVDAVIERDYLAEIEKATFFIICSFIEVDGDDINDAKTNNGSDAAYEVNLGGKMLNTLLIQRWKEKIAEFEEFRRRNGGGRK